MRALIEPEGFRYSSLTQMPSTSIRGVSPIASSTVAAAARSVGLLVSRPTSCAVIASGALHPLLDQARVGRDPLVRRGGPAHAVLGDVLGHLVLVVVGPV